MLSIRTPADAGFRAVRLVQLQRRQAGPGTYGSTLATLPDAGVTARLAHSRGDPGVRRRSRIVSYMNAYEEADMTQAGHTKLDSSIFGRVLITAEPRNLR